MFKTKIPESGLLENFEFNSQFTPDAVELEQKERQPLFVYDQLKHGHPYHHILEQEDAQFQQIAFTVERHFRMWAVRSSATPIVLQEPEPLWKTGFLPSHIKGELYYLPGSSFKNIDKYMKNTVQFERISVRLVLTRIVRVGSYPEGEFTYERRSHLRHAYMYVGITQFWDPIIDWHGFKLISPKWDSMIKQYYSFTAEEYDSEDI